MLRHRAHDKALMIRSVPEGLDFFFKERTHAMRLVEFIKSKFPARVQKSRKLVSHDTHSNTYKFKYVFCVDLPKVCKHDLVVIPKHLSKSCGGTS